MRHLILSPVAGLLAASTALAQASKHEHAQHDAPDPVEGQAHGVMSSRAGAPAHGRSSAHLRLSPARRATSADSARARAIYDTLRRAIAQYADTTAAVKDGFRMFAPGVKNQPVYHFTKGGNARRNERGFDAARPTSLLYERRDGRLRLVGAMYTAPRGSTPAELDARVPLGIAQWHLHTNVCVPKRRQRERWRETRGKQMKFGPAGAIATRADCDVADGRFHEEVLNWMVHVNTAQGRDLKVAFGERH
ncbi:MAG: hypothetical protein ACJ8AO_00155 [Gemmatimonadaceae bacterium]